MTQPIDIIKDAMSYIGVYAPGDNLEAVLAQQAFNVLNDMMDSWSNDDFTVISILETIADISGGPTAWTIGPGGMIDAPRPLRINSAFVRVSNFDYPVEILNVEEYELIGLKQLNGAWPTALYYNSATPLGIINFFPKPNSGEIHLFTDQIFDNFQTINDEILFPQGYFLAMKLGLADLLLTMYGKAGNQALVAKIGRSAAKALGRIKSTNMQPLQRVRFDPQMSVGKVVDAGFILNGGFN